VESKGAANVFTVSEAWKTTYPGAAVGILAMRGVINPRHHPLFDKHREELEKQLRSRYSGYDKAALKALPVIGAYNAYYKRFKKSYHVQLQLESVILRGKSIPRVAALVVLYGPDRRTRITPETEQVLFTVYVPPGIEEQLVSEHLRDIQVNVLMIAPDAKVEALEVHGTA